MPKKSERRKICEFLVENARKRVRLVEFLFSDDDEAVDEVYDDLRLDLLKACCKRNMGQCRENISKHIKFSESILMTMDDSQFREMLKVNREQFAYLQELLSNDEKFKKQKSQQIPVEMQLAITLFRLGSAGENASNRKISNIFGTGDGGTIRIVTQRVFGALLRLQSNYISWPNSAERSTIVEETMSELPYCIGYVDCIEIQLAEPPLLNHESYYSENGIYSIKVQIVCDHKLKIRDVVVGYRGKVSAASIFQNSSLSRQREKLFSPQQWLAGDSAYPLSDILITPYDSDDPHIDSSKRKQFNSRHSKYRSRVKQCVQMLKERFCSLKELRLRIDNTENHQFCCRWILVCCILHNILINENEVEEYQNTVEHNVDNDFNYDDSVLMDETKDTTSISNVKDMRQELYDLMFNKTD